MFTGLLYNYLEIVTIRYTKSDLVDLWKISDTGKIEKAVSIMKAKEAALKVENSKI